VALIAGILLTGLDWTGLDWTGLEFDFTPWGVHWITSGYNYLPSATLIVHIRTEVLVMGNIATGGAGLTQQSHSYRLDSKNKDSELCLLVLASYLAQPSRLSPLDSQQYMYLSFQ